jgi:hypothetical protein
MNTILSFDNFIKGGKLNDPKTALSVKAAEPQKKEKTIDQVKDLNLGKLDTTSPDYTKTVKNPVKESSADTQAEINSIAKTTELRKRLATATTDAERTTILSQIRDIQAAEEKAAKAPKLAS